MKSTIKSRTLIIGHCLVHSEQRTADTSAFNFMVIILMHDHYGNRCTTHPNALFLFLDGCQYFPLYCIGKFKSFGATLKFDPFFRLNGIMQTLLVAFSIKTYMACSVILS